MKYCLKEVITERGMITWKQRANAPDKDKKKNTKKGKLWKQRQAKKRTRDLGERKPEQRRRECI
jgi:hypothetical protein